MKYNKNNKLKLFEICAGYGSQALALNRLREIYPDFDYELVGWAEFDPEEDANPDINKQPAVIAHKVLHPDSADKNWGDITKIMLHIRTAIHLVLVPVLSLFSCSYCYQYVSLLFSSPHLRSHRNSSFPC